MIYGLYEKIKNLRIHSGMSQVQLAERREPKTLFRSGALFFVSSFRFHEKRQSYNLRRPEKAAYMAHSKMPDSVSLYNRSQSSLSNFTQTREALIRSGAQIAQQISSLAQKIT